MQTIKKALWYIEHNLSRDLSMDDLAASAHVSRFHLSRLFALTVGQSAMRYVRGRRLTLAAKQLASGAPDILSVALSSGYGSHEAFTRAFREQFGVTPETVRGRKTIDELELVEAITMPTQPTPEATPIRFEQSGVLLIAGYGHRFNRAGDPGIPMLWQRFGPKIGTVPGQVNNVAYGVICNFDQDGAYDYIAGVEVSRFAGLPDEYKTIRLPEQRYAVFLHKGHVAQIAATMHGIMEWARGVGPVDAPTLERYDERFNPMTGQGEVEVWLPVNVRR